MFVQAVSCIEFCALCTIRSSSLCFVLLSGWLASYVGQSEVPVPITTIFWWGVCTFNFSFFFPDVNLEMYGRMVGFHLVHRSCSVPRYTVMRRLCISSPPPLFFLVRNLHFYNSFKCVPGVAHAKNKVFFFFFFVLLLWYKWGF